MIVLESLNLGEKESTFAQSDSSGKSRSKSLRLQSKISKKVSFEDEANNNSK